jgi:GAF domain-containing protein
MSDNKKIRNRLDKLFTGINEPEVTEEGTPAKKGKPALTPAITAIPTTRKPSMHTGALTLAMPESLPNVTVAEAGPGASTTLMTVPFQAGDEWNLIQLEKESPQRWQEEDQALVRQVVDQLGLALQNAQLFQETQRQNSTLAVLNEMARELATQLSIQQVLESTYKFTSQLLEIESIFTTLYHPETETIEYPLAVEEGERIHIASRKIGNSLSDYVLKNQKTLLLNGDIAEQAKNLGVQVRTIGNQKHAVSWLGVPLVLGNRVLGAIIVQSTETPNLYGERERGLVTAIASQTAIALQNAQLFQQTEAQNRSLAILNEMGRELTSLRDLSEIAESLHKYTSKLMNGDNFFISLYNPEKDLMELIYLVIDSQLLPAQSLPVSGLSGWVFRHKDPLLLNGEVDHQAEALGVENIHLDVDENKLHSWLGVPLLLGDESLGALVVQSDQLAIQFRERERDLLLSIASQASISIQNARLFDETQKRTNELATLNEIVRAVSEQIELKQVLEVVYQELRKVVQLDVFFVGLYNEADKTVEFPLIIDEGAYYNEGRTPLNPNNFSGKTILSGRTIYETRTPEEAAVALSAETDGSIGNTTKSSGSLLFIPLRLGQKIIGLLSVQSYNLAVYSPEAIKLLENISNQVATAIQNANLFEETQRRNYELAVTNELIRETAQSLDYEAISKSAHKYVGLLMDAHSFFVTIYDEKRNLRHMPLVFDEGEPFAWTDSPLDNGASSWVIRNNQVLYLPANAEEMAKEYGCEFVLLGDKQPPKSWLGVPLSFGEKALGAIVVQSTRQDNLYTERHRDLLVSIANQVAIIVENARLYSQEQYRRSVADALSDMARIAGSSLDLGETVNRLLRETPRLLKFRTALIQLIGKDGRLEQAGAIQIDAQGTQTILIPKERSAGPVQDFPLLNKLNETREPIFIPDTLQDSRWEKTNETATVRSWLGAPLIVSNRVIGLLLLHDDHPNTYNEDSANLARSIAAQVASSIYNAQLFKQAQDHARREQLLREITARVRGSTDQDAILRTVVREVGQAFGAQTFISLKTSAPTAEKAPAEMQSAAGAPVEPETTPSPEKRPKNPPRKRAEGGK